jgi:hypothetical protein
MVLNIHYYLTFELFVNVIKSSAVIVRGWKSLVEVTIGPYLCDRLYRLIQSMPSSFGWQHIRFHRSIVCIISFLSSLTNPYTSVIYPTPPHKYHNYCSFPATSAMMLSPPPSAVPDDHEE